MSIFKSSSLVARDSKPGKMGIFKKMMNKNSKEDIASNKMFGSKKGKGLKMKKLNAKNNVMDSEGDEETGIGPTEDMDDMMDSTPKKKKMFGKSTNSGMNMMNKKPSISKKFFG